MGYALRKPEEEKVLTKHRFGPKSERLLYSSVRSGLFAFSAAAVIGGVYILGKEVSMGLWGLLRKHKAAVAPFAPLLTVSTRLGEDGYVIAECHQIPGCMSQGRNEREALRNISDAIQSCLAVRLAQ